MARQGHHLTIFSYEPGPLSAAGLKAEIRDAREVTGGDRDLLELLKTKPSTVSNFFRVAGLVDQRGIWVDLDCLLLQPLPDDPYLFGKIESGRINGAILKLPAGSGALIEYYRICRERPIKRVPAWLPFRRRLSRHIALKRAQITGGRLPNYPHGPIAVTHIADKHDLSHLARAHEVFYPIDSSEAAMLIDPVDRMRERITPRTICVHLWHGQLVKLLAGRLPPATSYVGKIHAHYGAGAAAPRTVQAMRHGNI